MTLLQIPDDQRLEYNQLFEQVSKMTSDLDPKLPLYFIIFRSEEFLRKYVAIVRFLISLSASRSPSYRRC